MNTAAKTAKAAAASQRGSAAPRITFNLEQFERDAEAAAAGLAAGAGGFQPDPYDGHLNHQELTKTLLDLSALYREAHRAGVRPGDHGAGRGREGGCLDRQERRDVTMTGLWLWWCCCVGEAVNGWLAGGSVEIKGRTAGHFMHGSHVLCRSVLQPLSGAVPLVFPLAALPACRCPARTRLSSCPTTSSSAGAPLAASRRQQPMWCACSTR